MTLVPINIAIFCKTGNLLYHGPGFEQLTFTSYKGLNNDQNYLFYATHEVVVGLGARQAERGLGASKEDRTGGQNWEASRGHPTLCVESVNSQGDLFK